MDNNKVLKKIEKLLNLAQSDNPNEAATALRQAKALMDKHGLTMDEIALSKISTKNIKSKRQNPPLWEKHLVSVISGYVGVECIAYPSWTKAGRRVIDSMTFVGVGNKPMVASYIFDYLTCCILLARKKFLKQLGTRDISHKYRIKKLADSYCEGWVIGVASNISEFLNGPEGDEKKLIEQHLEAENVQAAKAAKRKEKNEGEKAAMAFGHKEGKKVKINHGVGAPEPQVLLE